MKIIKGTEKLFYRIAKMEKRKNSDITENQNGQLLVEPEEIASTGHEYSNEF